MGRNGKYEATLNCRANKDVGRELGFQDIVAIGETSLANIGRPDYWVADNKLLFGHVELKVPSKGAGTVVARAI